MNRKPVRARLLALALAVPLALLLQTRVSGQEPALEVTYTRLDPKEQFKYKYKDKDGKIQEAVCTAGVFRWEVPRSEHSANGLDRNFTGYCAEVLVPIVAGKTYQFRTNNIYDATNYNLAGAAKDKTGDAANRRTRLVQELFGRYFRDPTLKATNATDAVAFQIALWEIIQETEPAEGEMKLDLFAGDFQANYPKADAPVYVTRAQEYLSSLTGKDEALLAENPDMKGRELIRLQGLTNADGSPTQSQYALRYKNGGAAGSGAFARALTAGGGGGFAGGGGFGGAPGGGVGGLGGGSGGGGFFSPGNGNSTSTPGSSAATTPTGTTTTTPPTTTVTTPPVGGPDTPTTPTNPTTPTPTPTPNPTPTNPVPAPAGLLLGMIALGTVGTWRFGARLLNAK